MCVHLIENSWDSTQLIRQQRGMHIDKTLISFANAAAAPKTSKRFGWKLMESNLMTLFSHQGGKRQ